MLYSDKSVFSIDFAMLVLLMWSRGEILCENTTQNMMMKYEYNWSDVNVVLKLRFEERKES